MPQTSLVVPLQNEDRTVEALLQSVLAQERLPDEIVIVDAGSHDRTAEKAASAIGAAIPLVILRRGLLRPGEARNEGVKRASHEWIAFTDGGIVLSPQWLQAMLREAANGADVVFGSYEPVCNSFFTRCASIAYVPAKSAWGGRGPTTVSLLLRRPLFEACGGFPSFRAAEDLAFFERVHAANPRTGYAPDAVAEWQMAPNLRLTFRRFAEYSRHNLKAGRARFWHLGLLRQYLVVAGLSGGLAAWVSGVAALGLLPAWLVARAAKAAWLKRHSLPFNTLDPRYILGAAVVVGAIDVATWMGALNWLREQLAEFC